VKPDAWMTDALIRVAERGSTVEELLSWVWKEGRGAKERGPDQAAASQTGGGGKWWGAERLRGKPPARRAKPVDPFSSNEVNLLLSALASNILLALRRLVTAATGICHRLNLLREKVLKVGAVLTCSSRRLILNVARSAVPLWGQITAKIDAFRLGLPPFASA
jgi:hypothetical protein